MNSWMGDTNEEPLCPELYRRLQLRYGSVKIARSGEAMPIRKIADPTRPKGYRREIEGWGEVYRVCCPLCGEVRHRCYIGHRWAEFPGLIKCYNETDCFRIKANKDKQHSLVFRGGRLAKIPVRPGRVYSVDQLKSVSVPGQISLLTDLPDDHPAVEYLRERGHDTNELADTYGVGYCWSVDRHIDKWLVDRIYTPIYMRNVLVGWQGRIVGPWKKGMRQPKYFTMPGMPKRLALYNYDQAVKMRHPILVEGVTDVWRMGPSAMALLGHTFSGPQLSALAICWGSKGGVLTLMLEDDSELDEATLQQLRRSFPAGVVKVPVSAKRDVGDLTVEENLSSIVAAASTQGVDPSFVTELY